MLKFVAIFALCLFLIGCQFIWHHTVEPTSVLAIHKQLLLDERQFFAQPLRVEKNILHTSEVTLVLAASARPVNATSTNLLLFLQNIRESMSDIDVIFGTTALGESVGAMDDSLRNETEKFRVLTYILPFSSTLSRIKTVLLTQVRTPYVLIMCISWQTKVTLDHDAFLHALSILRKTKADAIGIGTLFGTIHIDQQISFYEGASYISEEQPDSSCRRVDFLYGPLLGRTTSLLIHRWNGLLKYCADDVSYITMKHKKRVLLHCDIPFVEGASAQTPKKIAASNVATELHLMQQAVAHYVNVSSLSYCQSDATQLMPCDAAFPTDVLMKASLSSCMRLHLQPSQPMESIKSGTCLPGFAPPLCQTCLPGYAGTLCQKCDCVNGGACEGLNGACKCPTDFAGPQCELNLVTAKQLIRSGNFREQGKNISCDTKNTPLEDWHPYKDGCFTLRSGGVWIENNGSAACGLGQHVQLQQSRPGLVYCRSDLTVLNFKHYVSEEPFYIYTHVDIMFADNTTRWGQKEIFEIKSGMQESGISLLYSQPITWFRIFILSNNIAAKALLHRVQCFV